VPMMSRIGNKRLLRFSCLVGKKPAWKTHQGFTLLEVMIAVSVLALGAAIVYQSFFIAIDSFNYYSTLLKIAPWMDEKVWEVQSDFARMGSGAFVSSSGQLEMDNKKISWDLSYHPLDQTENFYQLDLVAAWPQGKRQVRLTRAAYALHLEK
jgi:prepilin-type N-terminal cleavage/methylation domain-containing protein